MTKKLIAVVLGLSAWIGGTVAASVGSTPAAAAPLFVIQRAHADYMPSLEGNDPIFILLLGSDSRPGTPMTKGRSDSIHILGINPAQQRATVFGIPRDSYVVTGFNEVTSAVNQIGGLEVDVPYGVQGYDQFFPSGLHRMTGSQVLGYSRTRHSLPLGDFDRSLNQGVVLKSALTQCRGEFARDPTRLYSWIGAGLRNTETNVPVDELVRLAGLAQSVPASRVTNLVAIGTSGMSGSQSIVNLSDANNALWQDMAQDGFILQKAIPANAQPDPQ